MDVLTEKEKKESSNMGGTALKFDTNGCRFRGE